MAWGTAYEVYTQLMNEDFEPDHPFGHKPPVRRAAFGCRSQTRPHTPHRRVHGQHPHRNIFSFGNVYHGYAYNNYDYPDGMRYRGRTLGFSLDSDSRLASLQASWIGAATAGPTR